MRHHKTTHQCEFSFDGQWTVTVLHTLTELMVLGHFCSSEGQSLWSNAPSDSRSYRWRGSPCDTAALPLSLNFPISHWWRLLCTVSPFRLCWFTVMQLIWSRHLDQRATRNSFPESYIYILKATRDIAKTWGTDHGISSTLSSVSAICVFAELIIEHCSRWGE